MSINSIPNHEQPSKCLLFLHLDHYTPTAIFPAKLRRHSITVRLVAVAGDGEEEASSSESDSGEELRSPELDSLARPRLRKAQKHAKTRPFRHESSRNPMLASSPLIPTPSIQALPRRRKR